MNFNLDFDSSVCKERGEKDVLTFIFNKWNSLSVFTIEICSNYNWNKFLQNLSSAFLIINILVRINKYTWKLY